MSHHFTIFHLSVSTPFELSGFSPSPPGRPEVFIRLGRVPAQLDEAEHVWRRNQLRGTEFLLTVPGVARYLVRGGKEIIIAPEPGAPPETLRLFLLGSAFGALLHQRGELLLHGSSVATDQGAILLLGRSGHGKSTVAALLSRGGRRLLGDDKAVILRKGDNMLLYAGPQQSWLWRDAIDRMGIEESELAGKRNGRDKYAWQAGPPVSNRPCPIYRIYELAFHESREPEMLPLQGPDAVRALMQNIFRRGIRRRMDGVEKCFQQCAHLAFRVPVRQLRRDKARHSPEHVLALIHADMEKPPGIPLRATDPFLYGGAQP
jgi:hypothetical protein